MVSGIKGWVRLLKVTRRGHEAEEGLMNRVKLYSVRGLRCTVSCGRALVLGVRERGQHMNKGQHGVKDRGRGWMTSRRGQGMGSRVREGCEERVQG
ncbi:hypothetical protein Pcinc_017076 [Petrolisthes cinctipes]|uniref:Uncharacterized protein n=1 Tax=Petrolisthes cinctipes TaxID=88211 RepID=A0AAE1FS68_PETCI|nr:hypothetical protein Pcinc_017076 [Petrolisthes cinctipes]